MKKQLEQTQEALPDLLCWIKEYIASKVLVIKAKEGFDRAKQSERILNCDTIEDFIEVQFDIRRNGQSTLITYTNPLINLYKFVEKEKNFISIKHFNTKMRNKIFIENKKGYTEKSQIAYLIQINGLFKYIEANALDGDEPYSFKLGRTKTGGRTKVPIRKDDEEITFLGAEDVRKFINGMKTFPFKGDNPSKPKLMMLFVLYGGVRAEELIALKRDNVEIVELDTPILKGRFLRLVIEGSRNTERVVHIKESLIKEEYSNYEKESPVCDTCDNGLFFCTYSKEKYVSGAIHQQAERLLNHAGVAKSARSIRLLRCSYASHMAINNVDFAIISELLGHDSEDIRNLYIKLSRNGMRLIPRQWEDF